LLGFHCDHCFGQSSFSTRFGKCFAYPVRSLPVFAQLADDDDCDGLQDDVLCGYRSSGGILHGACLSAPGHVFGLLPSGLLPSPETNGKTFLFLTQQTSKVRSGMPRVGPISIVLAPPYAKRGFFIFVAAGIFSLV